MSLSVLRRSLLELEGGAQSRVAWADISKAISMLMLVFWTVAGDRYYLNEMLILVRMPLFFFVSGLFAHRVVTRTSFPAFMRDKFGNFAYLYALWIGMLFVCIDLVAHFAHGEPIDPLRQLTIFWDPIFTIWFLYALAIAFLVAWLARGLPVGLVLAAALVLYVASVASGDWRYLPFLDRLVRLFPFFWLGLIAMPVLQTWVPRHWRLWPVFGAAFLGLAYFVFDSPWNDIGLLTFAISLTGIASLLLFSEHLARFRWTWSLAIVGGSTLYIYVMHKIVLYYLEEGLRLIGLHFSGIDVAKTLVIVAVCTMLGRWLARTRGLGWLFRAPWIDAKPARRTELAQA